MVRGMKSNWSSGSPSGLMSMQTVADGPPSTKFTDVLDPTNPICTAVREK